jgi:hypothetical protein
LSPWLKRALQRVTEDHTLVDGTPANGEHGNDERQQREQAGDERAERSSVLSFASATHGIG